FLTRLSVLPRSLHSFPTRRSSDLAFYYLMRILTLIVSAAALLFSACAPAEQGGNSGTGGDRLRIGFSMATVKEERWQRDREAFEDRKSTRLNSSHVKISYAVFCLK